MFQNCRNPGFAEDDEVEIEGFIDDFTSSSQFSVNGVPVDASTAVFEDGTAGDLALNVKVEVEGNFSNGVLVARKVEVKQARNIKIEARVEDVDAAAGTMTFFGGLVTVRVNNGTGFEDDLTELRSFSLSDIAPNDWLEVRASRIGSDIIASRVERDDPDDDVTLQGPVSAFTATTSITILGVSVETSGAQFEDQNDSLISGADFFNLLTDGSIVKAKGGIDVTGQTLIAREIEFESRL